jgi:hypothetical protein
LATCADDKEVCEMRGTRVKNTKLRTVHGRWWRSRAFWTWVLVVVVAAISVGLAILGGPNGGGGG